MELQIAYFESASSRFGHIDQWAWKQTWVLHVSIIFSILRFLNPNRFTGNAPFYETETGIKIHYESSHTYEVLRWFRSILSDIASDRASVRKNGRSF